MLLQVKRSPAPLPWLLWRALALGCPALASTGCLIVSPAEQDEALDPDHDSAPWEKDCDSTRADVQGPASVKLYVDDDGDGYGLIGSLTPWADMDCPPRDPLAGWSWVGGDCDDEDAAVSPAASESCDGDDDDCDTLVDEGSICSAGGEVVLAETTPQVRGAEAIAATGWALLGGHDLDGDAIPDAAIATLGSGRAEGGMVHVLYGPLESESAFDAETVRVLEGEDALGGTASASPDARTLEALLLEGAPVLVAGAPRSEASTGEGSGDLWAIDVARGREAVVTSLRPEVEAALSAPRALGAALAVAMGDPDHGVPGFLVAGAPETEVDGGAAGWSEAGAVVLLFHDGESLAGTATLVGQEHGQYVGASVGASGGDGSDGADLDGDGCADLVVGVWPLDQPGAIVLVQEACQGEGTAAPLEDLRSAQFLGADTADGVGSMVVVTSDLTGDGLADVIVGGPGASVNSAPAAGEVWLLRGASTISSSFHEASARWIAEDSYANLGASVAGAGDVNVDDQPDLAIGAPGAGAVAPEAGAVWVVYGPLGMAGETEDLMDEDAPALRVDGIQNLSELGRAVAPGGAGADGAGDMLLIGAPGADFGDESDGVAVGRVYLLNPD